MSVTRSFNKTTNLEYPGSIGLTTYQIVQKIKDGGLTKTQFWDQG